MASQTNTDSEESLSAQQTTSVTTVKFCPICGAEMTQGEMYGFQAWICPEGDYFEFID